MAYPSGMDLGLQFEHARGERLIAGGRVVLAVFASLVLWLDPDLAQASRPQVFPIAALFIVFALLSGALATMFATVGVASFRMRLGLHVADFVVFSAFIYMTHAAVSPFFIFFLFSLITALLRFGVRGMVVTSTLAVLVYVTMALTDEEIRGDPGYLIMRSASLAVATLLLARLGAHYERVRNELAKLAAWPSATTGEREPVLHQILALSCDLLGVQRTVLVWDEGEEPWANVAVLDGERFTLTRERPDFGERLFLGPLRSESFLLREVEEGGDVMVFDPGHPARSSATIVPEEVRDRLGIRNGISVPVQGRTASGRIFFQNGRNLTPADVVSAGVAARLIAASLDQLEAATRSREVAVAGERLRVGRDLHDGLLQALTAMALQIEMAARVAERDPGSARQRLQNVQELIVGEQQHLRAMISQLRPESGSPVPPLELRLRELAGRFARQWDVKVSLDIEQEVLSLPDALAAEIYNTINEGVANAAKHARAGSVNVVVRSEPARVTICLEDDGTGFPFHGTFSLAELNSQRRGPVTLKERVESLGGDLVLHSSSKGTRLEIGIPRGPSVVTAGMTR